MRLHARDDAMCSASIPSLLDYASNVGTLSQVPGILRIKQPPLLAVWGKNDPFFLPLALKRSKRDNRTLRCISTTRVHFALETHHQEIAGAIRDFLGPQGRVEGHRCIGRSIVRDKGNIQKITREKEHDQWKERCDPAFRKFSCDAAFIRTVRTFSIYSVHEFVCGSPDSRISTRQDGYRNLSAYLGPSSRLLREPPCCGVAPLLIACGLSTRVVQGACTAWKVVGIPFLMLGVLLRLLAWVGSNAVFGDGGWLWLSSQFRFWETSECIQG